MKYLVFLSFLLVACGSSEKKGISFGKDENPATGAVCPANYSPLPFFREGFAPLPGPDSLPAGTYRLTATEVYFRGDEGSLQAHFSDVERTGEIISRKICASQLPARALISVEFPAMREFTRSEADSHRPASAYIQGEKESFTFSKPMPGAVQTGSILAVLSKWSHWNIYKLTDTEYEIRLYTYETLNEWQIEKRMTMRFSFAPALSR